MKTWIIEPVDPVLFGDGRPFTAVPGSRATSLPLPPPSTLAGGVRTRHGQDRASILCLDVYDHRLTLINADTRCC